MEISDEKTRPLKLITIHSWPTVATQQASDHSRYGILITLKNDKKFCGQEMIKMGWVEISAHFKPFCIQNFKFPSNCFKILGMCSFRIFEILKMPHDHF